MGVNNVYATAAAVRRAISAVRVAGIEVGSVELAPDGSIRINAAKMSPPTPANEFDRWDASGRL